MMADQGEDGFAAEVQKHWPALKEALEKLIEKDGVIDQYYEETKRSQAADYAINKAYYDEEYTYPEEIRKLKKGTYKLKIRVRAAGDASYKPAEKTVTVRIKVKK